MAYNWYDTTAYINSIQEELSQYGNRLADRSKWDHKSLVQKQTKLILLNAFEEIAERYLREWPETEDNMFDEDGFNQIQRHINRIGKSFIRLEESNIIYVGPTRTYTSLYDAAVFAATLPRDRKVIIQMDAGKYVESNQVALPRNVDLRGESGGEVIINTHYVGTHDQDGCLLLTCEVALTLEDGNQTISNIIFDGGDTGYVFASIFYRSNVTFEDCTIRYFTRQGIVFEQLEVGWGEPAVYATGNSIKSCIFRDCANRDVLAGGAIWCGGQIGFEVANCRFYLDGRDPIPIRGYGNIMFILWVENFKYYNNISWKTEDGSVGWNIGLELWNSNGGNEIYNNVFYGGSGNTIDIAGVLNQKGTHDLSWWIHHNEFLLAAQTISYIHPPNAVTFEGANHDMLVSYNHIVNYAKPLSLGAKGTYSCSNITWCYNLVENYGYTNVNYGTGFYLGNTGLLSVLENMYIYNNTFKGYNASSGIRFNIRGTLTNVYIYNNVFEGVKDYGIGGTYYGWLDIENFSDAGDGHMVAPTEVSNIYVSNNTSYGNNFADEIWYWKVGIDMELEVINLVETDTLKTDPEYVTPWTDFHLQETSPSRGSGLTVGLLKDLDDVNVTNPPDRGVYQYVS